MKSILVGEIAKVINYTSPNGSQRITLAICPFGSLQNEVIEKWNNPKKDKNGKPIGHDEVYDALSQCKQGDTVAMQINNFYDVARHRYVTFVNHVYGKEQSEFIYKNCQPLKGDKVQKAG